MQWFSHPTGPRRTLAANLLVAGLLLIAIYSCSDEEPTPPGGTGAAQVGEGLAGLATFGVGALSNPETQVMTHPDVALLMNTVGLSVGSVTGGIGGLGGGILGSPALPPGVSRLVHGAPLLIPELGRVAITLPFGTYERDRADQTEPFPGWRWVLPGSPPDGLIFRWGADATDITYQDGAETRATAGELRFLGIVIDQTGPTSPADDIVTSMTHEMALGPDLQSLVTVARITFDMTLDAAREPTSIQIGDEADLASTFIGPLSFAFSLSALNGNIDLSIRLADTTTDPAYVLRLALSAAGLDPVTEIPTSLTFDFGFGQTTTPTNPPWEFSTTLDAFRTVGTEMVSDVNGTITFHDALLATYFGDTTTRFFDHDINRDGVVDDFDSCVNVDIRFTDTRETQSICEVFGGSAFPGTGPLASLGAATLATQPVSPLLWVRN